MSFDAWNVFFGQEKKIFFDAVLNVLFLAANFGKTSNEKKKSASSVLCTITSCFLFGFSLKVLRPGVLRKLGRRSDPGRRGNGEAIFRHDINRPYMSRPSR